MKSSRMILVVLVAFVVLFLLSLGLGVRNQSSPPPSGTNFTPGPITTLLGDVLSVFSPAVHLQPSKYIIPPLPAPITIGPANDDFRKLSFTVTSGTRITITYTAAAPAPSPIPVYYGSLHRQTWPTPNDRSNRGSFIILKSGGTITFGLMGTPGTVEFN